MRLGVKRTHRRKASVLSREEDEATFNRVLTGFMVSATGVVVNKSVGDSGQSAELLWPLICIFIYLLLFPQIELAALQGSPSSRPPAQTASAATGNYQGS